MRGALVLVLVASLALSGCGRLRDDGGPQPTPSPATSQPRTGEADTDEVNQLLDEAADTLDQVNRDLQAGDEAADKE